MEIKDCSPIYLPSDMDAECIDICNTLNCLPETETFESCCGHLKNRFSIWFFCRSIDVLSRLGRTVERNYSDGNWEIVVDSTDTYPRGVFWLRSKEPFKTQEESLESVNRLIKNIKHWFKDEFDAYFQTVPSCEGKVCILPGGVAYVEEKNQNALRRALLDNFKSEDEVVIKIEKKHPKPF